MTPAEIARFDRRELAIARAEYKAAEAAWLARGSDRNIDRFFAAERRLDQLKAAIRAARVT